MKLPTSSRKKLNVVTVSMTFGCALLHQCPVQIAQKLVMVGVFSLFPLPVSDRGLAPFGGSFPMVALNRRSHINT